MIRKMRVGDIVPATVVADYLSAGYMLVVEEVLEVPEDSPVSSRHNGTVAACCFILDVEGKAFPSLSDDSSLRFGVNQLLLVLACDGVREGVWEARLAVVNIFGVLVELGRRDTKTLDKPLSLWHRLIRWKRGPKHERLNKAGF